MFTKKILFLPIFILSLASCQNDSTDVQINPEEIFTKTNIYPTPPSQWMGNTTDTYFSAGYVGDVMPYFENGKFNLFFLHDAKTKPSGEGFHDIHSFETTDFVNYSYPGRMVPYGKTTEPDFGVGTGSMVKVGSTYYYYYTGHNGIGDFLQNNPRESVLLATSTDMKNWTKVKTFKITAPAGYYDFEFRDPHVFYNEQDSKYWMLISAQNNSRKAVVLKMTTTNPAAGNWVSEGPIYTSNAPENYIMLECPDLFKMGNNWYLLFSENWSQNSGTHYRIATSPNGPWTKPAHDRLDGSYLYAAKTASDGTNRFLFGWNARRVPENNTGQKDWAGNLVTHQLLQNSDGTLAVKQPQSIAAVFTQNTDLKIEQNSGTVSQSANTITLGNNSKALLNSLKAANQITLDFKIGSTGSTGMVFAQDALSGNGVKIAFEPQNNSVAAYLMNNGTEEEINKIPFIFESNRTYKITITISNDVCTLYIDDKTAFTNRIYDVNGKRWSIFNGNSSSLFSNIIIKNPK